MTPTGMTGTAVFVAAATLFLGGSLLTSVNAAGTPVSCSSFGIFNENHCDAYCGVVHPNEVADFSLLGSCSCGTTAVCDNVGPSDPTCDTFGVTSQGDCEDICGPTATFSNSDGCDCNGSSFCTFEEPNKIDCSAIGADSRPDCKALCQTGSMKGLLSFETPTSGITSCTCLAEFGALRLCGSDAAFDSSSEEDQDGDGDFSDAFSDPDVMLPFVRSLLISSLGKRCQSPVERAINKDVLKCILDEISEGDGPLSQVSEHRTAMTSEEIEEMCLSTCTARVFQAIGTLADNKCLPDDGDMSEEPSSFTGGDMEFDEGEFFEATEASNTADFEGSGASGSGDAVAGDAFLSFSRARNRANLFCTISSSNGLPCGEVLPIVENAVATNASKSACEEILDYGLCLGSIAYVAAEDPTVLSRLQGFNNTVALQLAQACKDLGVDGLTEAASGTEAPANISAATKVSASYATTFLAAALLSSIALFTL